MLKALGFKKNKEESVNQSEENVSGSITTPMQEQPMQEQPMQEQPMQGQPMQGQPMQEQSMQTEKTLKDKLLTEMLQMPINERNPVENLVNTALESLRKILFEKFRYPNETTESDYTFQGFTNRFKIDGSRPDVPGKFKGFKHNFTIILSKIRSFAWNDRSGKGKFDKQKNMILRDLDKLDRKIGVIINELKTNTSYYNHRRILEQVYFKVIQDKIKELIDLMNKNGESSYEKRTENFKGGNKTKSKKSKKNSTRRKR